MKINTWFLFSHFWPNQIPEIKLSKHVRFDVTCPKDDSRGIYLRDATTGESPVWETVTIAPKFPSDIPNEHKVSFELRSLLECSADWVEIPSHLVMASNGNTFTLKVDPTKLGQCFPSLLYFIILSFSF